MSQQNLNYDVVIIGGGSAGFASAIKASESNLKVLVIEEGVIGGTCLNVGCVPTKSLIGASRIMESVKTNSYSGVELDIKSFDFKKMIEQKRELLNELRQSKYISIYQDDPNIEIMNGSAAFINETQIMVNDKIIEATNFIIATGSRARVPNIKGLKDIEFLTNIEALELEELPKAITVIGGGVVGLEFAKMFQQFGSKVTILETESTILKNEEYEISQAIEQYLVEDGIKVHKNIDGLEVSETNNEKSVTFSIKGKKVTVKSDQILIATGRAANSEKLALDKAKINVDSHGFLKVNEHLQTSNNIVYGAGDVIGGYMLVTVDAHEGAVAMKNILGEKVKVTNQLAVPHAIFTTPEIASVGLTEIEAVKMGIDVDSRVLNMDKVPKALAIYKSRGLIKMVVEKHTRKILGVHIIGHLAAEIIQEAVLAIKYNLKVEDILDTIHVYPTMAEAIKLVAVSFVKDVSKLSCCAE